MPLVSPNDATEILYGASGDVRNEVNAYLAVTTGGHYADEQELPGALIIRSLERSTRLVNSYLEIVYPDQIPFTTIVGVPKLFDDVSSDIATYYTFRSLVAKIGPISEDKKQDYYEDHIKEPDGTLPLIRDKKRQLPELTVSTAEEVATARNSDRNAIFDIDSTTAQEADPDLLEDISDDRK